MKVLKLIGGYLALGWFFLFVDQSGIGFDKNVKAVHKWASGETPKLHFVQYWKMTAQGPGRKADAIPASQEAPEEIPEEAPEEAPEEYSDSEADE